MNCPHCGYCSSCGRVNGHYQPYNQNMSSQQYNGGSPLNSGAMAPQSEQSIRFAEFTSTPLLTQAEQSLSSTLQSCPIVVQEKKCR